MIFKTDIETSSEKYDSVLTGNYRVMDCSVTTTPSNILLTNLILYIVLGLVPKLMHHIPNSVGTVVFYTELLVTIHNLREFVASRLHSNVRIESLWHQDFIGTYA